jgi:hypothetical protein
VTTFRHTLTEVGGDIDVDVVLLRTTFYDGGRPPGLAPGGTTGQVATKASDASYDVEWTDPAAGGGAVDSVNGQTGVVVLDADDIADGTTNHAFTAADDTKLAGIATGATANSPDATLLARANHTGTQAISTVTGLQASLDGKDTSLAAHEADTTSVHGIADTAALETTTGSQAKADAAQAAAIAASQPVDSDLTAIAALSTTSFGRSLLALADAAAGRTALGLGTAATTAATAYDTAGAAAAAQAASQPLDSDLTAIAALSTTSYGRSVLEAANAAALRTLAGTVIGTDVQGYDAELAAIAGLTSAADRLPYFTGSGTASLATFTAAGRALVDDADAAAQRTTLGLGTSATVDTGTTSGTIPLLSTGGVLPIARLATGTPDGTKFVRDDGTLAAPSGGSGTAKKGIKAVRTAGNVTVGSTSWTAVDTALDLVVAAVAGDVIVLSLSGRTITSTVNPILLDMHTWVSGAGVNCVSLNAAVSATVEGVGAWRGVNSTDSGVGGSVGYTVQSGDIVSGNVTFRLVVRMVSATGTRLVVADGTNPLQVMAQNTGQ